MKSSNSNKVHHLACGLFAVAALMGAGGISGPAAAQVSGNFVVVSNYLFRGVTQTDDGPAVQGGFDFEQGSGLYAGTWLSNVDFGGKEDVEVDLYAGYRGDIGESGIGWDVGALYYLYPGGGDLDYAETYIALSYGLLSTSVAWTFWGEVSGASAFDTGDLYYNVGLDLPFELAQFSFNAFAGYYDFDEDGNPAAGGELSYGHWGLSAGRDLGDFGRLGVTYEQTDGGGRNVVATDDDATVWLGWTLEY